MLVWNKATNERQDTSCKLLQTVKLFSQNATNNNNNNNDAYNIYYFVIIITSSIWRHMRPLTNVLKIMNIYCLPHQKACFCIFFFPFSSHPHDNPIYPQSTSRGTFSIFISSTVFTCCLKSMDRQTDGS